MPPLTSRWDSYWFAPDVPTDLGVCRMVSCAVFLACFAGYDWSEWATVPDAFWMPIHFFKWFGLPRFGETSLYALGLAFNAALALAALGLFTRFSTVTAWLLGSYLTGFTQNFGAPNHAWNIVPLMLMVLALSRCGDGWSLDAWLRRRRKPSFTIEASGAYTWPIRTVWLLMSLVFMAAGVSKLRHGGLDWAMSDNMANILRLHYYTGHHPPTGLGLWLAERPWLYQPMAAATLIFETGAPLAMVSRRARIVVVPALLGMICGFKLLFNFMPYPFLALFVFWIPWRAWGSRLRRSPAELP